MLEFGAKSLLDLCCVCVCAFFPAHFCALHVFSIRHRRTENVTLNPKCQFSVHGTGQDLVCAIIFVLYYVVCPSI